ncbi:endonuclease domain-containing protein [Micromonospora radicis]|uniref:DUF559 domain-containing protein n=1 Tax=Micromonospora radicis TaxID=1894971 RepID=A0A418MNM5_9ACTN|nr:hypothetical protein [Micromonospora radicis]RIV32648.1 hypothetical protein D2L64_24920 [Micromonospora radicis]
MPPTPYRPAALAWQVFRGSAAIRDRLLTRHQLRGASWIRLMHDVYADARLDRDHELRCRAAGLRLPPGVLIAGPSAAYLHGVEHAATFDDDVHVLAPIRLGLGSQRGIRVHTLGPRHPPHLGADPAPPHSPHPAGGSALLRSDPISAAWECAVWLEPVLAVGIIDAMLRQQLVDCAGLDAVAGANARRPGGRRAGWVFGLADAGAQSPPESQLRVRLVLAGLPRPVTQHPVRLANGRVVHPDLSWPQYRVAVEYDGHRHSDPERLHLDRQRLNQLVGAGWRVLHVTGRRLHREFPGLLREIRTTLAAAGLR